MIYFIIGVIGGSIVSIVAIGICASGGRADLEMKIMELERKCYNLKTENTELISRLK